MLHREAECPTKQNILIANTILAEPGPYPGFKVWEAKYIFRRERLLFLSYVWSNFFWEQQDLGGHEKDLGITAPEYPRVCGLGQNRHQKVIQPSRLCRGG